MKVYFYHTFLLHTPWQIIAFGPTPFQDQGLLWKYIEMFSVKILIKIGIVQKDSLLQRNDTTQYLTIMLLIVA